MKYFLRVKSCLICLPKSLNTLITHKTFIKISKVDPKVNRKKVPYFLSSFFTFTDWPVSLQEVRLEIDLKQVASDALHGVINWQNMNAFSILHIWTRLNAKK